ncbi:hypothetical protein [Variovorax sp. JS1663]|uniref:hypothetical protein n=1 Tax=Variovorax sp. JS1663 TaxID=1851577 RepID=UPI0011805FD4|nr:hypothetical protein [Variovorax sp. JS1663]
MSTSPSEGAGAPAETNLAEYDGPWDKLRARVEPLLGDLEVHMGEHWHVALDQIFTRADLRVAERLRYRGKSDRQWFAVRPFLATNPIHDSDLRCAPSFEKAVGHLVEECRRRSTLPTAVKLDADRQTLDLWSGAELMFSVRPIEMRRVSDAARERAEGTIIGLRKFDHPEAELLKRVHRWPGLGGVAQEKNMKRGRAGAPYPAAEFWHHPVPKEWLLSARALCARCGRPDPERSFLESVAAAALDAPSWNHLASLHGDRTSELDGPWCLHVYAESEADLQDHGFYSDAIDAVADLLTRAPAEFIAKWPRAELHFSGMSDLPYYQFMRRTGNEHPFDWPGPTVGVTAIADVAETDEEDFLVDVARALSSVDPRPLEALFGIGRTDEERLGLIDTWAGEHPLVSDGPWRFTTSGTQMQCKALGSPVRRRRQVHRTCRCCCL